MADLNLRINVEGEEDLSGLSQGITGLGGTLGNFDNLARNIAVGGGLALLAGAAAAAGAAIFSAGNEFEDARKKIVAGTGASGEALDGMLTQVKNLNTGITGLDRDMGEIGSVIAEFNTRTGASGEFLEGMSGQLLKFTRISGDEAVPAVRLVTRVMGDWGVNVEDSTLLMDQLFTAGQTFGISLDSLAGKLVQFGSPMRQMGFSLEESIALLGKWEKEGVNTELVLGSLRIAAGNFAEENIDMAEGLQQTIKAIQDAETASEALSIAQGVFGARAASDMAAAIREGRFDIEDSIEALQNAKGSIDDTSSSMIDFRDQAKIAWEDLRTGVFVPLGAAFFEIASEAMPPITKFLTEEMVPKFEEWTDKAILWLTGDGGLIPSIRQAGEEETWSPLVEWLRDTNSEIDDLLGLGQQIFQWAEDTRKWIGGVFDAALRAENAVRRLVGLPEATGAPGNREPDLAVVNPQNLTPFGGEPRVEVVAPAPVMGPSLNPADPPGRPPVNLSDPSTYPSGMSVTNNFYGNPNADDVSTGIVEGARAIGIRE